MKFQMLCRITLFLLTVCFSAGCVRFFGGAGMVYQGPNDEQPKTRAVILDTQNLVPGAAPSDANIEV